ncbi:zinc finger BED domain-containing protein RICESLEEPER 2-like protein [Tanacetum coccineum]
MYQEECEEHVNVENVVPQTPELESTQKKNQRKLEQPQTVIGMGIHGTSTLRGHLKICDKFPGNMLDGQTQLSIQKGDGDDRKMIAWKFDQQTIRRSLAYMLIIDEIRSSSITMARDCVKLYLEEKKKVSVPRRGNVDNASANDVAVAYLKSKFINWEKFVLEGKWLHVHCTTHIMNLIVQDGLSHIGNSVDCVRAAVKYIRQSPQRLAKFKEYAKIEKCPSIKSSILDVSTRWNSTYLMLDAAQKYERAIARYDSVDCYYRDDLEKTGVPISSDWVNVRRLTKFLEHFYELTLKVSGTLYVTSNSFLDDITSINAAFRGHYCINGVPETNLAAMAKMMKCKFDKYYGSLEKCNMATVVAFVLDPRNKIEYVEVLLGDVYGKINGKAMYAMIKASLVELYEDYVRIHASPETHTMFESGDASSSTNKHSATATLVRMEMKRRKSESGLQDTKSELDRYLNEDVEDESEKFDILNWWKVNSLRFPVLSLLARDVLAIPISTVASESVFSTSGRVLDAFRSSLSPHVVESLICTQDWFRENSMMLDVAENWDEIPKIEEARERWKQYCLRWSSEMID